MLSFERDVEALRQQLGPATDVLLAKERRDVFSVHAELRLLSWGGAMLLATAAGILLKNNLERIGPLALALLMALAAAACYAWAWLHRNRASLLDDSLLLLGALIASGDIAFVETQFHLFGDAWYRQFLVAGVLHAIGAYAYSSRTLLSLSITAFAAWMGIERGSFDNLEPADYCMRALACAALVLLWRAADARAAAGKGRAFSETFEHFAANFALTAGVALMFNDAWRTAGCFLTIALAAAVIAWGFRSGREPFVLYAFVYGVIAVDVLLTQHLREEVLIALIILASSIAAIAGLFVIHARFQERRA